MQPAANLIGLFVFHQLVHHQLNLSLMPKTKYNPEVKTAIFNIKRLLLISDVGK